MRRGGVASLLLLALLAPGASAGSFTLGADRHMAQDSGTDGVTVFAMPVTLNQDGFVYAKLLATEGNPVNDGYHANGSVEARTGWRIAFAWIDANGTRTEMGSFVDGTPSAILPVHAQDNGTLVLTVRWPADAQTVGGSEQTVWTAFAYRASETGSGPGATSGVSMDEARAIGASVRFAPGVATAAPGIGTAPTPASPATSGPTTATPGGPAKPTASSEAPATRPSNATSENALPPVGPIESTGGQTTRVFVDAPIPTWFLVSVLFLGGIGVGALALLSLGVYLLAKREIPVRQEAPPTSVPVEVGRTHERPREVGRER